MKRICCAAILAALCIHGMAPAATTYKKVLIEGVPHVKQRPDFCGEACAEMMLRKLKHDVGQDEVFNEARLSPVHGRGSDPAPDASAARQLAVGGGEGVRVEFS